jgi:hypothetical protein
MEIIMSDNVYSGNPGLNGLIPKPDKDTPEEKESQLAFPTELELRNMRFLNTYGPACSTCGERLWPRNMVILDDTYGMASCGDCIERAK